MFRYTHSKGGTLILASVLAISGGYALAQPADDGPPDGDRPMRKQVDGERGPRRGGDAGERGMRGQRDPGAILKRLFAGMELTDEQKAQIGEIMKAHAEERRAWHEEHKEEFDAIREQMREARGDQEAMDALREKVHALMDSAPKPDATHDQIRTLLTEEQQTTFDERIAKLRERMEQMREGRPDGPPPGEGMGPDGNRPPRGEGMGPDGDGPPRDAQRRGPGGGLFGNLNLSDEQKEQLRDIVRSDKTRDEKIEAVKEILNEEQQAQLDKNIEQMRKFREENRGDRRGRGEGPRGNRRGQDDGPPPPPPPAKNELDL